MKLSDQALGAIMMALQESLLNLRIKDGNSSYSMDFLKIRAEESTRERKGKGPVKFGGILLKMGSSIFIGCGQLWRQCIVL